MSEIEILKKAIARKHPCNECHEALKRIEEVVDMAASTAVGIINMTDDKYVQEMAVNIADTLIGLLKVQDL